MKYKRNERIKKNKLVDRLILFLIILKEFFCLVLFQILPITTHLSYADLLNYFLYKNYKCHKRKVLVIFIVLISFSRGALGNFRVHEEY